MPLLLRALVVPVVCCALGWLEPAAAQKFSIGSRGASLELTAGWKRQKLDPAGGEDQFLHVQDGRVTMLVVTEIALLAEDKAAMVERLTLITEAVRSQVAGLASPIARSTFRGRRGGGHASVDFTAEIDGASLQYSAHLVSRDGLSYLLLFWGVDERSRDLSRLASRVARNLSFPGPDTAWGRSARLREREVVVGEHVVHYATRDSALPEIEEPGDAVRTLAAESDEVVVFFFHWQNEGRAEEVLRQIRAAIESDFEACAEVRRDTVRVADRDAHQLVLQGTTAPIVSHQVLLLPLGDRGFLDLRIHHDGPAEHFQDLREELIESIRIADRPRLDAFPVVEPPAAGQGLGEHQARLLEGAKVLATESDGIRDALRLTDGRLLVATLRSVLLLEPVPGSQEVLLTSESWDWSRTLAFDGRRVFATDDGELMELDPPRDPSSAGGATHLASLPNRRELLLVRPAPAAPIADLFSPGLSASSQLFRRTARGSEQLLTTFDGYSVNAMATEGAGKTLLLAMEALDSAGSGDPERLAFVSIRDGEVLREESWQYVYAIGPAPQGWVVTGQPIGAARGVYLVPSAGEIELLIGGEFPMAFGLHGEKLLLSSTLTPPGVPADEGQHLLEIPLDHVRAHGPACAALTATMIDDLARKVLRQVGVDAHTAAPLASRETVAAIVAAAKEHAKGGTGMSFPDTPARLDELIGNAADTVVDREGVVLLAALLTDQLLAMGAVWAEAAPQGGSMLQNAFAWGCDPVQFLQSMMSDGRDWWQPASEIRFLAEGREFVLGPDRDAIAAAVEARDRPEALAALGTRPLPELQELLAAHPRNAYLRQRVYEALARADRRGQMHALSMSFVTADHGYAVDARALFACRIERGLSPKSAEELIADLRGAITADPEDASFYYLLGRAYEASTVDQAVELARRCYEKTVEVERWGNWTRAAQERLGALDG